MTLLKQYRVRSGRRFGFRNQFSAGDTILLTENEASGFLDKLELIESDEKPVIAYTTEEILSGVTDEEPDVVPEDDENEEPDPAVDNEDPIEYADPYTETEKTLADRYVAAYSVKKILGLIASGAVTAEEVLEAERAGKNRKSLISKLEDRLG